MISVLYSVSTLLLFISRTVSETQAANSQGNTSYCGQFAYRGKTSYSDLSLLISELSPVNTDISLGYCAHQCHNNLECNAVEMCSLATGTTCRLSREIATSLATGTGTCSRYEMEHTCGWGSFFDRQRNICQCVIDCECDALTPSIGSTVTHTVVLNDQRFLTNCMNSDGHIWTMIQRRVDGSVNFYRNWTEYKSGFGDLNSEFWIGLDNIRLLVENNYTILRVELEELTEFVYAEYSSFYIAGEEDNYRIQLSGYTGTAGDGLSCSVVHCHNNAQFSTYDRDNDNTATSNSAEQWRGAWWYGDGHRSNLNGEYGNNNHGEGNSWYYFKGWTNALSATRMMLRRG